MVEGKGFVGPALHFLTILRSMPLRHDASSGQKAHSSGEIPLPEKRGCRDDLFETGPVRLRHGGARRQKR
jgi:hypothetical protein